MAHSKSVIVEAIYREASDPEYKGNPLIEALPDVLPSEKVGAIFTQRPNFAQNEVQMPEQYRRHMIGRLLRDFSEPFNHHHALEESISALIRLGYVGRNPAQGDHIKHILNGYERVQGGDLALFRFKDVRSTALSTSLIGCSGIGKTWALNRILATYPQAILHSEYQLTQVVWLKLDCPRDGSLKALCREFFVALDQVLGTDYVANRWRERTSVNEHLANMAAKANQHCLGILVIDEIQHLDRAKSGGDAAMLNFFVTLVNTIGVPVLLVGTHKATEILQQDFRQARRACGMGDHVWDRLTKDGDDWNYLIKALWDYQWTVNCTPLTPDLQDHLYDLTQGVVDIAIKLFVQAQYRAMSLGGDELLTKGLFDQVMADSFQMVQPMLEALRFGDTERISQYGDLCAPLVVEKLEAARRATRKKGGGARNAAATHVTAQQVDSWVSALGIGKDIVGLVLDELLTADPDLAENHLLLFRKLVEAVSAGEPQSRSKPHVKRQASFQDGDLRLLHKQAVEQGRDVYEALLEAKYIKGVEELAVL